MTTAIDDIRAAVLQQLRTDQLLGIKSLPMVLAARPMVAEPASTPARGDSRTVDRRTAPATREAATQREPAGTRDRESVGAEPVARSMTPAGRAALPPPLSSEERTRRLRTLDETEVKGCRKCGLCETRTNTVFGQGNVNARLVFVGEGPGYDEDQQGLAFVGKAGQLLTKMIAAMGTTRDEVFICNVVKCRPPNNRDPAPEEILACSPYLREQLRVIQPEAIVALGAPATKTLLNTMQSIGKLRGRFHDYFLSGVAGDGPSIPLMPTYHPAYLLRAPEEKAKTWDDLQKVMTLLGLAAKTGA